MQNLKDSFGRFATRVTNFTGNYVAFILAFLIVLIWAFCGPIFGYSETWQLVINTGTTIITFLMVFLIQYSQNKDSKVFHIKLDEIIRSIDKANDRITGIETLSDIKLEELRLKNGTNLNTETQLTTSKD